MEEKKDIWSEGIKSILGYHKRALLDFIDEIVRDVSHPRERERFGRIKGRIHNDFGQATLSIGILLETYRKGGDIEPFKDSIIGKQNFLKQRREEAHKRGKEAFNQPRVSHVQNHSKTNRNG